ncbi:DUF3046 domain-containing protein [Humidisolicoccus flavus]|uniref:DUF3046 domain-containing protein n=1 Tax=Humidisolicoccus flavus TaxID=3111414 RepID=UPI0032476000
MRRSEFDRAVEQEFGAFGRVLVDDLALTPFGSVSARAALAAGESPRAVWLALCDAADVAPERRHGVGLREP